MGVGYKIDGTDLKQTCVPKSYLIDNYPYLLDNFRFEGIWATGENSDGALGDGSRTNKSSPVVACGGSPNWRELCAGSSMTAAIKADGTLWVWGGNSWGQLGTNNRTYYSSPVQTVAGGTNWKQVSTGYLYTAAIKTDGTLWVWGYNNNGVLGTNNSTYYSSPVQTIAGGTNWKQVSCGERYGSAAIKTDGTLWVWGFNLLGQLGDNTTISKSSPVQTVAEGTNWKQVAVGDGYMTAIKTDGTLWTWGSGVIGVYSSPVQTVAGGTNWKQVSCPYKHVAAVKTDGTLWLWGYNNSGQLGDNTTADKTSPVQTVAGGTDWKQVSCGHFHTSAIKTDGTLWVWGSNPYGELGTYNTISKSSPVQTVSQGNSWLKVSSTLYRTMAIRDNSDDLL